MKYVLILLMAGVGLEYSFSQTDTLYVDPLSGNFLIRYIGTTKGGEDTLITLIYEPPTKIDPIINASVAPTSDGRYLYSYRVTNGANAQQKLNQFSLHFGSGVSVESRTPVTSWDNARPKKFLPEIGFANRWVWRGHQGLEPTWFIDSCMIVSDGLPSLTESYSQAKRGSWAWPAGGPSQSDLRAQLLRLQIYPNANVLRRTIGPKAISTPFTPLVFLDTLISYKHQAFEMGWIREEGIVTSLDAKLEAARPQIINGRPSAKQILESFVNELEALNTQGNQITSEAYALLKFNAEYLISKL